MFIETHEQYNLIYMGRVRLGITFWALDISAPDISVQQNYNNKKNIYGFINIYIFAELYLNINLNSECLINIIYY